MLEMKLLQRASNQTHMNERLTSSHPFSFSAPEEHNSAHGQQADKEQSPSPAREEIVKPPSMAFPRKGDAATPS